MSRLVPIWAVAAAVVGCTRLVGGTALPPAALPAPDGAVDLGRVMLGTPRMRAIVGADEQLTVIPTMDSSSPTDIDDLAATIPPPCRFVFVETAVFGSAPTRFHKTTYQYPPKAAMVSEGAAVYPDAETAHHALDALVATVAECADTSAGPGLVSDWDADDESLRTHAGDCGRAYQVKSVVLLEVTYCGFSESDADLVVANMASAVPG
ncbi:sensor domain-containing protein [Mycolicibacter heraklionensis]|uniref:Sensor domain-containing protein n=1 Tax=Mycolicibacter heraklionensis TaxID=512402 RepID=A0A9X7ZJ36_9MYCO|nr:sensor domain-containing protein [Mycolicibacter heraklionensis]QZA10177.1 sensor domain-containing protein [Mycolicibacter heraklionensis]